MNCIGIYFCLFLVTGSCLNSVAAATLPLRRTALLWEGNSPRRHYEELIASRQTRNSFGKYCKALCISHCKQQSVKQYV